MPKRSHNKFDSTYTNKKWKNRQSRRWRCVGFSYGGWWTPPVGGGTINKAAKKDKNKRIRQDNKSIIEMECDDYYTWFDDEIYAYSDDTEDSIINIEWYYNYEDIPIWNCCICRYKNIERLSYCSFCNHPYCDTNTRNDPNEKDTAADKTNEDTETDVSEIYKHYHDDLILKIEFNRKKRKLLNIFLSEKNIDILHSKINNIQIKCIINDYWLKRVSLQQITDDNIIYIKNPSQWYSKTKYLCSRSNTAFAFHDHAMDKEILSNLLKYNSMIKMCDIASFLNMFLINHDFNMFVPFDIINLCISFCGILPQLLPFASVIMDMKYVDNVSISKFESVSFTTLEYTHDILEANNWLRKSREYEILVGIIICDTIPAASDCINYSDFLPIFSLERTSQLYHLSQPIKTEWIGWLKRFHTNQSANASNIIHSDKIIKSISKHADSCNKERYNSINDRRILKYVKKRDKQRYLRRKWSAYTKLQT